MLKSKLITLLFLSLFLDFAAYAAPGVPQSDQWIEGRIQGALDFNNSFDSTDVDVRVGGNIITLSGEVPTEAAKKFADRVAAKLGTGKKVVNNLKINEELIARGRTDLEQFIADVSLTAKIKTKLLASKSTYLSEIEVETNNGVVFLTGTVDSDFIKAQAGRIAEATPGLRNVKNQIKLADPDSIGDKVENTVVELDKKVSDAWVSTKVRTMLLFSSDFPGNDVIVLTKDGVVELKGFVRSVDQKDKLSDQVNDVIGVRRVMNMVEVRRLY